MRERGHGTKEGREWKERRRGNELDDYALYIAVLTHHRERRWAPAMLFGYFDPYLPYTELFGESLRRASLPPCGETLHRSLRGVTSFTVLYAHSRVLHRLLILYPTFCLLCCEERQGTDGDLKGVLDACYTATYHFANRLMFFITARFKPQLHYTALCRVT